ncbi:unnamed protein product [Tuber aestivum]|uniref:Uncharacterized protein n=1 Tax=Tuber aestivum TaxID=59557 RepID=A0A292PZG3_9PEZI|nr:unnamed protein product [Tuber aestivum]
MTVISAAGDILPTEKTLVSGQLSQIERSLVLSADHLDSGTATYGSGPAFYTIILEAIAGGGVMIGHSE